MSNAELAYVAIAATALGVLAGRTLLGKLVGFMAALMWMRFGFIYMDNPGQDLLIALPAFFLGILMVLLIGWSLLPGRTVD